MATTCVRWRGLLIYAIDGTTMSGSDSKQNLAEFTKHRCNHGGSGYLLIRALALVCCGTRSVADAVFGPTTSGEFGYAHRLLSSLRQGMIVLWDRGFDATTLVSAIVATGAHLLVRLKNNRRLPVCRRYSYGSYLSRLGGIAVRISARRSKPSHRSPR